MKFDITKYNYKQIEKVFANMAGINFAVGNTHYSGVTGITSEKYHVFDGDPIPGEWDGGGNDYIDIVFRFENGGEAKVSFCPDLEHCEVTEEEDDFWIFHIEDIPKYVERVKSNLDYMLKEYEEYIKN